MLKSSGKLREQGIMYKQYIEVVVNQGIRNISQIAEQVGKNRELVIKQLQQMIDVGFFKNAQMDLSADEIILTGIQKQKYSLQEEKKNVKQETVQTNQKPVETPMQQRVLVCDGCGAKNVVTVNRICYCEYCDSPLEG